MPNRSLPTRRNVLASLATLGIGGALGVGGVLNTSGIQARSGDPTSKTGTGFTAGELNLALDWWLFYRGRCLTTDEQPATDNPAPMIALADLKPGDYGGGCIGIHLRGSPAWVWLGGSLLSNDENDQPEPEAEVETDDRVGDGHGELADAVQFALFPLGDCDNCDGTTESEARAFVRDSTPGNSPFGEFEPLAQGTLGDVLASISGGHLLDDAPKASRKSGLHPGRTYYLGFLWWVPETVGNEIQTDSVAFDLDFYAEQCSDNSNPRTPFSNPNR